MTITYSARVATCRGLGNFWRLLARWKGSIYKLVWLDMLMYLICYFSISCFYRFYLAKNPTSSGHTTFVEVVTYCDNYSKYIPLSFILGFYVGIIMTRWWDQFKLLPWPDPLATLISTHIQGQDERGRLMRRTMMRYVNFSFVFTMTLMSPPAKKRFPSMNHMVEAGFLLPHEQVIIEHLNQKTNYSKYWVPIIWAGAILARARRENRIPDDMCLNEIIMQLTKWRSGLGDLLGYDWASMPLMYTQGVTLAVNLYFVAALLGKQFILSNQRIDLYLPIFTMIEFFFYMGWLKVAETLINPFGEDGTSNFKAFQRLQPYHLFRLQSSLNDDFEVNWLIDRNIQVSYQIVDEMHLQHPPMLKDAYWDADGRVELPYTEAAAKYKTEGQQGSAINYMDVDPDKGPLVEDKDLEMVTVKYNNRASAMSMSMRQASKISRQNV